ncbi:MAG: N-acetyltransferase [Verrucomicrobiales bacterium]|nr:N-acetyltransferase [Verrucomicrobiales bacterium]
MQYIHVRPAVSADAAAISEIYNHYVLHSTATYQEQPESLAERHAWMEAHGPEHPVFIAELKDDHGRTRVAGWASLNRFHARSAYRHTVENSVYVHPALQRRGAGRLLLERLIEAGRCAGHRSIVALISADQEPSIRLHLACGFVEAGRLRAVGMKFDQWLDVVYFQLGL